MPARLILPALLLALILGLFVFSVLGMVSWLQPDELSPRHFEELDRLAAIWHWKVQAKGVVVREVVRSHLTLLEAIAWMYRLDAWAGHCKENRSIEREGQEIVDVLYSWTWIDAPGWRICPEVAQRVEAELQLLLDSPERLILPEPPKLPGMPPRPAN